MEEFITKYTSLPKAFIEDFYSITGENHSETDLIISFDVALKWINIRKDNLKKLLVTNFEKKYDYTIEKINIKKDVGATHKEIIMISSQCFKELCMLSYSAKAKGVRKYFLEMEKIVRKYYDVIKEQMLKQIGLLKNNQKPKIKIKGGVIYILEAMNNDLSGSILGTKLYKFGKTTDIKTRLNTYNSGNANNVEPLFIVKVDDINKVEKCVKTQLEQYQYRKYKEVYEIDIEIFKHVISTCDDFTDELKNYFATHKKDAKKKIERLKKKEHKFFMMFEKNK